MRTLTSRLISVYLYICTSASRSLKKVLVGIHGRSISWYECWSFALRTPFVHRVSANVPNVPAQLQYRQTTFCLEKALLHSSQ